MFFRPKVERRPTPTARSRTAGGDHAPANSLFLLVVAVAVVTQRQIEVVAIAPNIRVLSRTVNVAIKVKTIMMKPSFLIV